MKNRHKDLVDRQRAEHHAALKAMLPSGDLRTGKSVWRQLHRLESMANRICERLCSDETLNQEDADNQLEQIEHKVEKVFGYRPKGFFINRDPRGYALKLEAGSVPYKLHEDWGRYQILAPTID